MEESHDGFRYEFETFSDYGQDVLQSITVSDPDDESEIADALYDMWQDFDPEAETMLWVDSEGKGKNGAPDLRECLADMDSVDESLEEFWHEFRNYSDAECA